MDFDSIMRDITSGLTGNSEEDIAYLKKQAEAHKTHPLATEIVRACFRLMYDLIPEDKKAEFERAISNDADGINAALDEIRFLAYKKDFGKALALMEPLVSKVEKMNAFADDAVSEYHTFREPFEEILYFHQKKPGKHLRQAQLPYSEIYTLYGSVLFDLKRFEEAKQALAKAVRWNPINAPIAYEHAETFKMLGDMQEFLRLTKEIMRRAFRPQDLARGFRNLGYYFAETRLYEVAAGCLSLSLVYEEESSAAQSELYYIQSKTGGKLMQPTKEQLHQYAGQYGFPLGASEDVLGLAHAYAQRMLEEKRFDHARYFLEIVHGLTDDEEVGALLEQIQELNN